MPLAGDSADLFPPKAGKQSQRCQEYHGTNPPVASAFTAIKMLGAGCPGWDPVCQEGAEVPAAPSWCPGEPCSAPRSCRERCEGVMKAAVCSSHQGSLSLWCGATRWVRWLCGWRLWGLVSAVPLAFLIFISGLAFYCSFSGISAFPNMFMCWGKRNGWI